MFSHSGYKYYVVFLDDYTHYLWTIPLRNKSDVRPSIHAFISYVRTQFRLPILAFQIDNGREYDSNAMRLLLSSLGTQPRLSCPYTSQQNRKAERILHAVNDSLHTMLIHSAAPLEFWAEALATATYLINLCLFRAAGTMTPYELLFGVASSYDELRVFTVSASPTRSQCWLINSPHARPPASSLAIRWIIVATPATRLRGGASSPLNTLSSTRPSSHSATTSGPCWQILTRSPKVDTKSSSSAMTPEMFVGTS